MEKHDEIFSDGYGNRCDMGIVQLVGKEIFQTIEPLCNYSHY